jgi:hypothetical protein
LEKGKSVQAMPAQLHVAIAQHNNSTLHHKSSYGTRKLQSPGHSSTNGTLPPVSFYSKLAQPDIFSFTMTSNIGNFETT